MANNKNAAASKLAKAKWHKTSAGNAGKELGSIGGKKRASTLSAARRTAIARQGAKAKHANR